MVSDAAALELDTNNVVASPLIYALLVCAVPATGPDRARNLSCILRFDLVENSSIEAAHAFLQHRSATHDCVTANSDLQWQ